MGVGDAAGGDIYAGTDVEIYIADTTFTGSEAEYGGAAIECCGGSITNSTFSYTKSDMLGVSFFSRKLCTFFLPLSFMSSAPLAPTLHYDLLHANRGHCSCVCTWVTSPGNYPHTG